MERPLFDTPLFTSPLVKIASFRADPAHPQFRNSGPTENHIFVFPRTSVRIQHVDKAPFITSPNVVTFYNRDQVYLRDRVTRDGDACEWFALDPGLLLDAVRSHDPSATDRPDHPFLFTHGPSDPRTYLLQRLLVRHLIEAGPLDSLFVEETVVRLFDRVLASAFRVFEPPAAPAKEPRGRSFETVEAAQAVLAARYREPLSLEEIAQQAGVSVFHLCRLFRRRTGFSLHAWQTQLRLREALERVTEPGIDLTDLALDLGYSSHSHFTAAFRQAFGMPPSALHAAATARRARELADRLLPAALDQEKSRAGPRSPTLRWDASPEGEVKTR